VSAPLSLDLLRTFLAVHREGSFTAAAQQLSLSQPTVTAQIRALEARTGRALFTRRPRGVLPTAYADLLARRIADPLDRLAAVTAEEGEPESVRGVVQLGGPAEFTAARLLPALAGLVARGLQLRVTLGVTEELNAALDAGTVDLAVLTSRRRRAGLQVEPLCDEEFVLVAAPGRAAAVTGPLPGALAGSPLVSYGEELPIIRRYWRSVFGVRPGRDAAVVVPDLRAALAAVLAGAGHTVLPGYLCRTELDAGRLVLLHRPELPPINTLYLAARSSALTSPAVAAVRSRLLVAARGW
jgi:DNA-binding transcriptional LysR family regulator